MHNLVDIRQPDGTKITRKVGETNDKGLTGIGVE